MEQPRYTHGHAEPVLRSHRWRTAENSAAYLLPHLRATDRLLDVGCGPGTITADLATRVGHVTGVEPSAEAVAAARQAAADRGVDVELLVGDLASVALADASYDVVHAHQVLQHVADPVGLLTEMTRVCRPGGLVAARDSDYSAFTWYPDVPGLHTWLEVYLAVARANGGEPDAGRRLLAWAHAAGLDDVTATAGSWCFSTPEDRTWWAGLWSDRMLTTAVGERAVALGLTDRDGLVEVAQAWRTWAAHPDGWFLVPHGEVLARVG